MEKKNIGLRRIRNMSMQHHLNGIKISHHHLIYTYDGRLVHFLLQFWFGEDNKYKTRFLHGPLNVAPRQLNSGPPQFKIMHHYI